jgi:hypothetical protein
MRATTNGARNARSTKQRMGSESKSWWDSPRARGDAQPSSVGNSGEMTRFVQRWLYRRPVAGLAAALAVGILVGIWAKRR